MRHSPHNKQYGSNSSCSTWDLATHPLLVTVLTTWARMTTPVRPNLLAQGRLTPLHNLAPHSSGTRACAYMILPRVPQGLELPRSFRPGLLVSAGGSSKGPGQGIWVGTRVLLGWAVSGCGRIVWSRGSGAGWVIPQPWVVPGRFWRSVLACT